MNVKTDKVNQTKYVSAVGVLCTTWLILIFR